MSKTVLVERGRDYLPKVELPELEEMYRRERPGKSRDRLQAAVLRKRGEKLEEIAHTMGRVISTIHRWLFRMGREGLDSRHDCKIPGRPRLLSTEQVIEGELDETPRNSGFERGSWNAKMISKRILERFGVSYSTRSAIRLAHRLGFTVRKPRPVPYNNATPEEQSEFIKKGKATATRWRARVGPSWR